MSITGRHGPGHQRAAAERAVRSLPEARTALPDRGSSGERGRSFRRDARAFVLGLGTNGLGAVRSLGEHGVRVSGVDWRRDAPGFRSRYCDGLVCADPTLEPERVLELLLARGSRLDAPAVLLPTGDAFVQFLSRYERELRRWFLFALPEPPAREALVDKRLQYELAAQVGTPCPRTWPLRQWDDLARIAREVEYPAVLKPCAAHLWRSVFRNKGFLVDGPAELERRCAEIAPHGLEMLVQSFVPGPPTNLYLLHAYIDDGDRPLAVWTKRKLRQYPVELGTGTLSESVRCEEVKQLGLELLRRVRYRGIGYVEFKRDERDGRFKLIELNGRLPQSNIHAARCGVNFPLVAYLDLTGQKPEPQMEYRLGVRYLDAVNDFQAFWTLYGRGELGPVEWLRSIAGARVFAHFDWRDPLPFVAANQYGLLFARLPQYLWLHRHGRSTVSGSER